MTKPLTVTTISEMEYLVGNNKTSLIEGNIIYVIASGEQTSEMAKKQEEINRKLAELVDGKISYLIDLNNCGKNSPEARDTWSKLSEEENTDKVAVFGIHPVAKVIAAFVMKFSKKEMHFFNTKEKAMDWLKDHNNQNELEI